MKAMKTNLFSLLLSGIVVSSLFLISCEKTDDIDEAGVTITDFETKSANIEDINYTDEVFDEVTDLGDEAMNYYSSKESGLKSGDNFKFTRLSDCVTITKVITLGEKVVTIDFGNENCEGNDGRMRRGQIIITHTGSYWDKYVEISFDFIEFYVDDNLVIGEKSVVRTISSDSLRVETIISDGAIVFADSSGTFTRTAEYERTFIEGSDTKTKRDDVISRTGGSTCTLVDGTVNTTTIIEPLIRKNEHGCSKFFVAGIKEIIKGDESPITVDYGDGTCDNLAEISQDGVTEVIELNGRKHKRQ